MKNFTKIDLDAFLGSSSQEEPESPRQSYGACMPDSDKVTVVGIFTDDSGSIRESCLTRDIISSVELAVEAFKGARGADFYLSIRGFNGSYYEGMLKGFKTQFQSDYDPSFGSTPLVYHTSAHLRDLQSKAQEYAMQGIPASIAYLIITDGLPNHDEHPSCFKKLITEGLLVAGIGVRRDENDIAAYREVFSGMGINKVLTPKATGTEIRHAVNEFSRSVVSGAVSA